MKREEKEKKLNTLPWQALHDNALKCGVPSDEIKSKDKKALIKTILEYEAFDDRKIDELLDDYIYGDRVTFTLWKMGTLLSDEKKKVINNLSDMLITDLGLTHFKNLKLLSVKEVQHRYEILYVYVKEYTYTNEEGYVDSVWEQHRGCVWIGQLVPYMACISKHDKMTLYISKYIAKVVEATISQIKPPKTAIEKCLKQQVISRKVLQGINGEKTIISNSVGLTDEQMIELKNIQAGRMDTSGSYITEIYDDVQATVKYNHGKGNMGIYKHLPSDILFEWTNNAIEIIFDEIEKLKNSSAQELFESLGLNIKWYMLSPEEIVQMNRLLSYIISSMEIKEYQVALQMEELSILQNSQLFYKIPRIYCDECGSYEIAYCEDCGTLMNLNESKQLTCSNCGGKKIVCTEKHSDCKIKYMYIPTQMCKQQLYKNLMQVCPEKQELKICVLDDYLYITKGILEDCGAEIYLEDVECFNLNDKKDKDIARYQEYAVQMKEKCVGGCSHKKVNKCVLNNTMSCLPKIFYTVVPSFRPQPHKGGEYGDISGQIVANGHTYEMKGIIKKNTKNSANNSIDTMLSTVLLSSSKAGEEIIRQFVEQGIADQRCNVIAVIAPQYFDADLKGTLRFLAKLSNKKVLFIELDGICRILAISKAIDINS